jgi:hypothetical protein
MKLLVMQLSLPSRHSIQPKYIRPTKIHLFQIWFYIYIYIYICVCVCVFFFAGPTVESIYSPFPPFCNSMFEG